MRAKHAMFAGVAVFLAVFPSAGLATVCPDAGSGVAVSCTTNYQPVDVVIDQFPVTAIVNEVDNSLTLHEVRGESGEPRLNFVTSAPTTTIYNWIENTVNVHILGPAGTLISSSINGNPLMTIDSAVDDSVNASDLNDPFTFTQIESLPTTIIYDHVDNGINITPDLPGASLPSQNATLITPTSQTIVIDNEPVTALLNQVDNSVTIFETISTQTGINTTIVNNIPTTNIFNLVDNTIDVWLSDPLGIPIDLSIDSMPNTLIEDLVDNHVTVTVPEPSSWSLLALGFCAFGLLRRATSRRAKLPALRRSGHLTASAT